MITRILLAACCSCVLATAQDAAPSLPAATLRTVFEVRYVTRNAVYIDAGSADGIATGMIIEITRSPGGAAAIDRQGVATTVVTAVATASAVCEIQTRTLDPARGDQARLSAADETARVRADVAQNRRRYLQVIEFTEGDPLEEEIREYVPHPPLPEVDRFRGRVAFDHTAIFNHDAASSSSSQNGGVIRVDWSRIGSSYWTLTGYWRGSFTSVQTSQTTLNDLMNRTYQIGVFYSNPKSPWMIGAGRLLLPWASSLGAIDGGYVARKMNPSVTLGIFAGTNPDPTQWNYAPNRQTTGALVNIEKGSYDGIHWSGTAGVAFSRLNWRPERQYLFLENNFSVGRTFSIFQSAQADYRDPKLMNGATGAQLSQSFLTLRWAPTRRVTFDLNDNYFRGVPTFDTRLIGTGLLDQYLFTGLSGGIRVEPFGSNLALSATIGNSRRNGDTRHSINQAYGVSWKRLPWIDARLDARYNQFSSSFGSGSYESIGLTRELFDGLRLQFQGGIQNTQSPYTTQTRARFWNALVDWQFGRHYFINGGWLNYRGLSQNYDQVSFMLGYRF